MIERLEIKKFGTIENIDIELKPIMVFIGSQASGKSTISKLISLFRAWEFIFNETKFQDLLKHYGISSYLSDDSYIKFTSEHLTFEWSNGKPNLIKALDHPYHIAKNEFDERRKILKDIPVHEDLKGLKNDLNNIQLELKLDNLSQERRNVLEHEEVELTERIAKHQLYQTSLGAFAIEVFKLENYSEYIPSERIFVSMASGLFMNLSNNKVPLPGTLLYFGAEFEKARQEIKSLNVDFLGAKYKHENSEDRIYIGNEKYIPFKESASGFQTLIPMLLVIDYKTNSEQSNGLTFVVEEPELNLFPAAQKHLVKKLVEKCASYYYDHEKFTNELVITTHSPYVLASLNNLLLAHNIATKKPNSISKIEEIIPKRSWIDSNKFSAYALGNGEARSIIDNDSLLISESELDSVSEEINSEFDLLMDVYTHDNSTSK